MVADVPRGPPCIAPASWMIAGAPGAELSTDLNPPPAAPGPLPYSKRGVIVFTWKSTQFKSFNSSSCSCYEIFTTCTYIAP